MRWPVLAVVVAVLCTAPAACGLASSSSGRASAGQSSGSAVTLPASEVRTLRSRSTGISYDLYLGYPAGYSRSSATRYPVLYLLDAQWDFKLVQAIYDDQQYDGQVPALLIVGITYSGTKPDYDALRTHDYTPVVDEKVAHSGGGPAFLTFVRDELIPFVERNYAVDPHRRVLMGSSYGGLFTLYTMFTDPGLFSDYLAASPAVTFGDNSVVKQEEAYSQKRSDLPTRLWIGVGGAEGLNWPVRSFWQSLTNHAYRGLALQTQVIDGAGHAGSKPEAYSRGLRYLFAPPASSQVLRS